MLYTIGSIVGASSTGVVWSRFGARTGYALGAGVFALGTTACALAPDMARLSLARAVQGWAGGLVAGGGMALITSLFDAQAAHPHHRHVAGHLYGVPSGRADRRRLVRGDELVARLVLADGAVHAALRRGSPGSRIPDRLDTEAEHGRLPPFRSSGLATLTGGVCCVAATGPVENACAARLLIVAAVVLVGAAFRLDRDRRQQPFSASALSINAPIGLCAVGPAVPRACRRPR